MAVLQLTYHHLPPLARTGQLMGDLFGLPMFDATVPAIRAKAQVRLAPEDPGPSPSHAPPSTVSTNDTGCMSWECPC